MIQVHISQGDDLANRDGKTTLVEIETRREVYRVTASKAGNTATVHRRIDIPRGDGKRLYGLLAEVFARLA